jgi:transposase-like protein
MERRKFTREFKLEAVRLIKDRGVSYVQASRDLGVHPSQLRDWVKKVADDPQHAFLGHGQMKPEQLEIARLMREAAKLKAERGDANARMDGGTRRRGRDWPDLVARRDVQLGPRGRLGMSLAGISRPAECKLSTG